MATGLVVGDFSNLCNCSCNIFNIHHDAIITLYDDYQKLAEYLNAIAKGEFQNINKIVFNNLLFNLTNDDHKRVGNIFIQIMEEHAKISKDKLQKELSVDNFFKLHDEFNSKFETFTKIAWYYEKNVTNVDAVGNKYSMLNLIKDTIFYLNIIDAKYTFMGKEYELYEIFNKYIANGQVSIEMIIKLNQLMNKYEKMNTYSVNANHMFNPMVYNNLIKSLGSNQNFIKYYVKLINDMILTQDDQLKSLLDIIGQLKEKALFELYYRLFFEKRIFNGQFNIESEKNTISSIQYKFKLNEFIQNIKNQIADIEESNSLMQHLRNNVKIKVVSTKAKTNVGSECQLEKFNFIAMRPNMLQNIDTISCKPPPEIEPYLVVFDKYYKLKYQEEREIQMNYNYGTSIIEIEIGGKVYNIKLSTLQLFVFMQFNTHETMSVIELEQETGIGRVDLAPILNSFLRCNLFKRNNGASNDPNNKFSINEDFVSDDLNISLFDVLEKVQEVYKQKEYLEKEKEKLIMDKFAIGQNSILKAKIVNIMKQKKTISYQELHDIVINSPDLPFKPTLEMMKEMIQKTIDEKYIIVNSENICEYVEFVEVDSDDSDDSDNSDFEDGYYESDFSDDDDIYS